MSDKYFDFLKINEKVNKLGYISMQIDVNK